MPKSVERRTHAELIASMRQEVEAARARIAELERDNRKYWRPDAVTAVRVMSDYVNSMASRPQEFVELFAQEHRTLQQSFTRIALLWLWTLAQVPDRRYDARNEASVLKARELMQTQDEYVWRLPCI